MTDPVRIGGFFANFDTEAVIQQMTFARQGAIRKLDIQTTKANAQKGVIAGIQASLSALLARATLLMGTSSVTGKKATVTNPTNAANAVSVAASPTSTTGTFTVDVLKLATSSKVAGTAVSAGIDTTSPIGLSNFGVTPTNGKFSMATATGGAAVFTIGAQAAQPATLLNASNLFLAPTNGTFTIATATGGSATLTIDTAAQTLQDVVTAINGTATGITATITNDANGRANVLTLTSTQGNITVGAVGDTSNFAAAMNLPSGPAVSATVASSAAFTRQMSLNDVITDINGSAIGVTATITNDANGRPNILSIASTQGALSLGNATDTSNFLSATNLLASPLGATRVSTNSIARLSLSAKMNVATFQGGPPVVGDHSFTINGTTINYNTANDSVADIIGRITSSAAGVTARYDSTTDTVKLQQVKTGTLNITMAEDGLGGNLLAKLGLLAGTSTLGESAQYKIDGGATQLSATNTVTTGTGVSLTFATETGAGTPATVIVWPRNRP